MTQPIDTAIPLPPPYKKFAMLDRLEVGESVFYPLSEYNTLGSCITFRQRRSEKRYTRRTQDGVIRVWRTI
jgi:hypothetical protein